MTWVLAGWVVGGANENLKLAGLVFVLLAVVVNILKDWRSGLYLFLVWLLFEDLARKHLGNNMYIYFGKDVLVGITYISFFKAVSRGRAPRFRPPFLRVLMFFVWLGVIQMFNPYSPSILYGFLGLKLYFYYIPLLFVGYALVETGEDLRRFLVFNLGFAALIAILGATQAVQGPDFLNPQVLAPDLQDLGRLYRYNPGTGEMVYRPTSVFVSDGRFGWYLILMWLVALGTAGYLFLRSTRRGRNIVFLATGAVAAGLVFSGSRGAMMWSTGSTLVLAAALLWGAPWRWRQGHRLVKAVRRLVLAAGISVVVVIFGYQQAFGMRWNFYSDTLSPSSRYSELAYRSWDYPIRNFQMALSSPEWPYGHGLGTGSLGVQYVSRFLGQNPPGYVVENGFGTMVLEVGILGPILWVAWTLALLISGWKVIRRLKATPYFPIGFAIYWFAFLLLLPLTFMGMAPYQNFVLNAYLWLLVGVMFRLPSLADMPVVAAPALRPRPMLPLLQWSKLGHRIR